MTQRKERKGKERKGKETDRKRARADRADQPEIPHPNVAMRDLNGKLDPKNVIPPYKVFVMKKQH